MRVSAAVLTLGLVLVACGKEPVSIPTLRLSPADQAVRNVFEITRLTKPLSVVGSLDEGLHQPSPDASTPQSLGLGPSVG